MSRKSLGQLTIDVVANIGGFANGMDKSERATEKWRKNVEKQAKAAGTALGIGISVAVAGLTTLTVATARQAAEIGKLSQVAGVGVVEFQRFAAGADAFGIQQDKLADIFKDTQDKVGDFLQNGGGPLADFFDNIAPKVGVTAKQFQNLSGPQALQLYADSLQKANLSQGDMVFYMEALANDATMLTPLLRDGGQGFADFADAAERAGAIMGEDVVADGQKLKVQMWLVEQQLTGFKNSLVADILPVITDLGATLVGSGESGRKALQDYNAIGTVIRWISQAAAGGVAAFDLLGKTIGGTAAVIGEIPSGWDAMMQTRQTVKDDLDATAQYWAGVIGDFGKAGTAAGAASAEVEKLQALLGQAGAGSGATGSQGGNAKATKDAAAAQRQLQQAYEAANLQYKRQIALFDTSADRSAKATELQQLNFEMAEGALRGLNAEKRESLRAGAAELDQLNAVKDATERAAKAASDFAKLRSELNREDSVGLDLARERLKTLQAAAAAGAANDPEFVATAAKAIGQIGGGAESSYQGPDALYGGSAGEFDKIDKAVKKENAEYEAKLTALKEYREARSDLEEGWNATEEQLKAEHQDRLDALDKARWQVATTAAESALGSVTDALRTGFGEQSALYKSAFIAMKAFSIAKAALAAKDAVSSALSSGLPFPANLAAMATAAVAVANLVSEVSAVGMAHDGIDSVPETGTWLLQKGERVTTASTSAKLDATLDRVNRDSNGGNSGGPITQEITINGNPDNRTVELIRQAARDGAQMGYERVKSDMARGTGVSKTMRATHNVGRRVR